MTKRRMALWGGLWAVWLLSGCMSDDDGGQEGTSRSGIEAPMGLGDGEDAPEGGGSVSSGPSTTGSFAPAPAMAGSSSGTPSDSDSASGASPPSSSGAAGAGGSGASSAAGGFAEPPPFVPPRVSPQSGILTAGAWDDNLNFERFRDFRNELLQSAATGRLPTTDAEHTTAYELFSGDRDARTTLDIALVIDTTGSMGDELAFLQTELLAISRTIESQHPGAEQRWSLVVYKDEGDEYVTRWFDFRSDADDFRTKLSEQTAGGGGDFPEAPDQAFEVMNQLAWRKGEDTARLAFWVADAPPHDDKVGAMADAIRDAAEQGIHVYPVASSGIDQSTELGMRSAAQLTGGRYLFLTDDSGVGGAHLEPSIPCYFVTRLDQAIVRMVDIELSGAYVEPDPSQVIRTGGDPQDRACTLESGDEVVAF